MGKVHGLSALHLLSAELSAELRLLLPAFSGTSCRFISSSGRSPPPLPRLPPSLCPHPSTRLTPAELIQENARTTWALCGQPALHHSQCGPSSTLPPLLTSPSCQRCMHHPSLRGAATLPTPCTPLALGLPRTVVCFFARRRVVSTRCCLLLLSLTCINTSTQQLSRCTLRPGRAAHFES